ncbi:hypothetical protein E2C01_087958 [Portunus trituberculatus]|uniref:Uncharacterized protein n=1 Tax=Portunus trituberculatus TaxID=210409 RepID=A0A5B7JHW5_PORTR|nr:hypothetical protein [Portunus trituberculatus]
MTRKITHETLARPVAGDVLHPSCKISTT